MGLVFMIVAGAILGWLTAFVRGLKAFGLKINIAAGIAGALVAGLVVSPFIVRGDLMKGYYSVEALLISLLGSVLLLLAVNLLRRSALR